MMHSENKFKAMSMALLKKIFKSSVTKDKIYALFVSAEACPDNELISPFIIKSIFHPDPDLRSAGLTLLEYYGDSANLANVLKALEMEDSYEKMVKPFEYSLALLAIGEPALERVLKLWNSSKSSPFSKLACAEYLERQLMKTDG